MSAASQPGAPRRFSCPACGFAVFNRRLAACERCGQALPQDMRYDGHDLDRIAREVRRIDGLRDDLKREIDAEEERQRRRRGDGG